MAKRNCFHHNHVEIRMVVFYSRNRYILFYSLFLKIYLRPASSWMDVLCYHQTTSIPANFDHLGSCWDIKTCLSFINLIECQKLYNFLHNSFQAVKYGLKIIQINNDVIIVLETKKTLWNHLLDLDIKSKTRATRPVNAKCSEEVSFTF